MSLPWAWFFLIIATYPWLFATDLLSSTLANTGLNYFITGATLIAPCRRLKRWQAVLFAGCVGFMFEAYRPIPSGSLAISLVALAILLGNYRTYLRPTLATTQAAIVINALAALIWFSAAAYGSESHTDVYNLIYQAAIQTTLSGLMGLVIIIPLSSTQNWVMDKMGVPSAHDLL
jgi:hypothetical protein